MLGRIVRKFINIIWTHFYLFRYRKCLVGGRNCIIKDIRISGKGKVRVLNNAVVNRCRFIFWGDMNDKVEIGEDANVLGVEFILSHGNSNSIEIGRNTTIGGGGRLKLLKVLR